MNPPSASTASTGTRENTRSWMLAGSVVLAAATWAFVDAPSEHPNVPWMSAIAVLMAALWISEALPLAATSLIPMVALPLAGILEPGRTVSAYINSTIVLYLGGFLIALAMEHWNLHRRIALNVIARFGARPGSLVAGFLVATGGLSMWISNTATAVMMLPIGLAVVGQVDSVFGREKARPLAVGLMLAIAYGASIGGCATLIGTPPNLAFKAIYEKTFPNAPTIAFGQWILFGLPFAVILLVVTWVFLSRVFWRVDRSVQLDAADIQRELQALGPMRREEKFILAVFASTAFLWTFRQDIPLGDVLTIPGWSNLAAPLRGLDDGSIAIAMALLLFIIPGVQKGKRRRLLEAGVFQEVPWGVILLFGGGFALAEGFRSSGLSAHLAAQFGAVAHLPAWLILALVCLVINFLTELTSNTATAQIFLPVMAAWATGQGIEPLYVMIPVTLSASMAFMLPVATPPNAIVLAGGHVTIRDMARTGIALNLISIAVTTAFGHWILPLIFGFPRP